MYLEASSTFSAMWWGFVSSSSSLILVPPYIARLFLRIQNPRYKENGPPTSQCSSPYWKIFNLPHHYTGTRAYINIEVKPCSLSQYQVQLGETNHEPGETGNWEGSLWVSTERPKRSVVRCLLDSFTGHRVGAEASVYKQF